MDKNGLSPDGVKTRPGNFAYGCSDATSKNWVTDFDA